MRAIIKDGYCAVCGKYFIIAPENIYKVTIKGKVMHLCSWSCLVQHRKEREEKKKRKER